MKQLFEIVCIDDETEILEVYSSLLNEKGYPVKVFRSSLEAKIYIEKNVNKIGAIICDLKMPDLDGVSLLREVSSKFGNLPFFLVSGFIDSSTLSEIEDKIAGHFSKPFNSNILEEKVLNLVSKTKTDFSDKIEFGKGFAEEALPKVLELEQLFLDMEKKPHDKAAVQSVYRILHTLKGTAATIGLSYLAIFCHSFEANLIPIRDHDQTPSKELISSFLKAQAHLLYFFTELQNGSLVEVTEFEEFLNGNSAIPADVPNNIGSSNKLSVSVDVLNSFVEGIGELTLMRNLIHQKIETITNIDFKHSEERRFLIKTLGEMQKIQSSMQVSAEELLKIPFSTITTLIQRNIREVCTKLSKKVTLIIDGASVLFDHKSLQAINDALVHLIRNSVDHGLELPEERASIGKPTVGELIIKVTEESERITLVLKDDGAGINTNKVLEKALKNRLVLPENAENMKPEEINSLIFMPGFSTSDQVTDVSGRGVGLDSVKKSIEAVGGQVSVNSEKGIGTTFTLSVPKNRSVSIVKVAVVKSQKLKRFAVPSNELVVVEKLEKVKSESRILHKDGTSFVQYSGVFLPILELTEQNDSNVLVILKKEKSYAAILADDLEKSEDVILRDLDETATNLVSYKKAAISGNFGVLLLLDTITSGLLKQRSSG